MNAPTTAAAHTAANETTLQLAVLSPEAQAFLAEEAPPYEPLRLRDTRRPHAKPAHPIRDLTLWRFAVQAFALWLAPSSAAVAVVAQTTDPPAISQPDPSSTDPAALDST